MFLFAIPGIVGSTINDYIIHSLANKALDRDIEGGDLVRRYNNEALVKKVASVEAEKNEVLAYLSAKEQFKSAAAQGVDAETPAPPVAVAPALPKG